MTVQPPPLDTRCVTLRAADDAERTCVLRVQGSLGRGALVRIDAVLNAVEDIPQPLVVDLSAARTDDVRLLRLVTRVVGRRRAAGRRARLCGVHPDVLPDPDQASLFETFLVYEAVRGARHQDLATGDAGRWAAPERDLQPAG